LGVPAGLGVLGARAAGRGPGSGPPQNRL
jgi:hypothetical protein